MLLMIAGGLFFIAMLLLFIDKMVDNVSVDLMRPMRVLLILSALLIGIHTFLK